MFGRFVNHPLINFIADHKSIPFFREISYELQFIKSKDFAYRIVRSIDNDSFRLLIKKTGQFFFVKHPISRAHGTSSFRLENKKCRNDSSSLFHVENFREPYRF